MFDIANVFVWPDEVILESSVERVSLPERIKFVFRGEEVFPEIFRVIVADKRSIDYHHIPFDCWYSIDGWDRLYAYHNGVAYKISGYYDDYDDCMEDRSRKAVRDLEDVPELEDYYIDTINLLRMDIEELPEKIILQ